jgi:hypothetical protein
MGHAVVAGKVTTSLPCNSNCEDDLGRVTRPLFLSPHWGVRAIRLTRMKKAAPPVRECRPSRVYGCREASLLKTLTGTVNLSGFCEFRNPRSFVARLRAAISARHWSMFEAAFIFYIFPRWTYALRSHWLGPSSPLRWPPTSPSPLLA